LTTLVRYVGVTVVAEATAGANAREPAAKPTITTFVIHVLPFVNYLWVADAAVPLKRSNPHARHATPPSCLV
jgi:hypothetical protein